MEAETSTIPKEENEAMEVETGCKEDSTNNEDAEDIETEAINEDASQENGGG
jgi:hypothetical protein